MGRRKLSKSEKNKRIQEIPSSRFDTVVDNKETFKSIIIACEDSVSAPTYFENIIEDLRRSKKIKNSSLVIAKHKHTHPTGVLQDLLNHQSEEQGIKKTYKNFDHCWIVIDRDKGTPTHTIQNFKEAINQAKNKKIKVAYANDAFELWYLLHFDYVDTPMDRTELITMLLDKLKEKYSEGFANFTTKNIKNENNTKLIFDTLLNVQQRAIDNAEKLLQFYGSEHDAEKDNPSTTIHQLVELLNNLETTIIDEKIQKIVCTNIYSYIRNLSMKENEKLPSYFFENEEFTKNKKAFEEVMAILIEEDILKKEGVDYYLMSIENFKNYVNLSNILYLY